MTEPNTEVPQMSVVLACTKRGCGKEIEVADAGEIFDGTEGKCPACGRIYRATEYASGTMKMVFDRDETRREARRVARRSTTPTPESRS